MTTGNMNELYQKRVEPSVIQNCINLLGERKKSKLNLKLSVSLEPVWIFPITTIIWSDARLHIPIIKKSTLAVKRKT